MIGHTAKTTFSWNTSNFSKLVGFERDFSTGVYAQLPLQTRAVSCDLKSTYLSKEETRKERGKWGMWEWWATWAWGVQSFPLASTLVLSLHPSLWYPIVLLKKWSKMLLYPWSNYSICICTFLYICNLLSQKSQLFKQVRLFLRELKGKRVPGGTEQPRGTWSACR